MRYSYRRLSHLDQSLDKPHYGVELDNDYEDVVSARDWSRSQLKEMLKNIETGDEVYVSEMSELGISLCDVKKNIDVILNAGGSISFLTEKLRFDGDKTDSCQMAMLQLLEMTCRCERRLIWQRQRVGIEKAKKKKGKYLGRRSKFTDDQIKQIQQEFVTSDDKIALAAKWGISRAYLYKIVKAGRERN